MLFYFIRICQGINNVDLVQDNFNNMPLPINVNLLSFLVVWLRHTENDTNQETHHKWGLVWNLKISSLNNLNKIKFKIKLWSIIQISLYFFRTRKIFVPFTKLTIKIVWIYFTTLLLNLMWRIHFLLSCNFRLLIEIFKASHAPLST